jgi:hypothetical protein
MLQSCSLSQGLRPTHTYKGMCLASGDFVFPSRNIFHVNASSCYETFLNLQQIEINANTLILDIRTREQSMTLFPQHIPRRRSVIIADHW